MCLASSKSLVCRIFLGALVAQLDVHPAGYHGGHEFDPHQVLQHSFIEINHEMFSMVNFSLFQEVRERMSTNTVVNRLED